MKNWELNELMELLTKQWEKGNVHVLEGNFGLSISVAKLDIDEIGEENE